MPRKISATKLHSLCSKGEFILIVEGTVIKSPPYGKMRNESSYKKRWMDLVNIFPYSSKKNVTPTSSFLAPLFPPDKIGLKIVKLFFDMLPTHTDSLLHF